VRHEAVDVRTWAADLNNGVLTLKIPVAESSKPRRISLKQRSETAPTPAGETATTQ